MRKKLPIALLIYSLLHSLAYSQTLTGRVSDEAGKFLEFANVTLHRAVDSVFVKAALSDNQGQFEFENLSAGQFFVRVTQVGYRRFSSPAFVINAENPNVNLRVLALVQDTKNLNEVVVRAQKPFLERKLDRLIVNVEGSIVSTGTSILEVLERSPGVVVNQESSINLKGKQGVVVMIDGKPTPLSGADLINYLKGVPSATVNGSSSATFSVTSPTLVSGLAPVGGITVNNASPATVRATTSETMIYMYDRTAGSTIATRWRPSTAWNHWQRKKAIADYDAGFIQVEVHDASGNEVWLYTTLCNVDTP